MVDGEDEEYPNEFDSYHENWFINNTFYNNIHKRLNIIFCYENSSIRCFFHSSFFASSSGQPNLHHPNHHCHRARHSLWNSWYSQLYCLNYHNFQYFLISCSDNNEQNRSGDRDFEIKRNSFHRYSDSLSQHLSTVQLQYWILSLPNYWTDSFYFSQCEGEQCECWWNFSGKTVWSTF